MMYQAISKLSGRENIAEAWDALIRHLNKIQGRSDQGYASGEKIMIKVNLVGCINISVWGGVNTDTYELDSMRDYMNTSPQVMLALLRNLVKVVGVKV